MAFICHLSHQLFTVIKSGDVHPNPGPVKTPYRIGHCPVARTNRSLRCISCFYDVHIKCGEVSAQTFTHNNEHHIPWTCPACDIPSHNFTDSFFSNDDSDLNNSTISDTSTNSSDSDFVSVNHLHYVRTSNMKNFLATYLNINSLRNKISEVKDIIQKNSLDFMCIAETKLDDSFKEGTFKLDNYRSFRKDNTSMTGGLYAYVRSDIPCQRRPDLENKTMESLCIEVNLGKTKWLMMCLYKIQHIKDHEFEEIMTDMIDNIILDYDKYLIMGDVNFNMLDEHQSTNSVSQICDLFDLRNIITQPTCFKSPRGTLIDVILSPNRKCIQTQGIVDTGLSDYHRMIYVVTKNHAPVPQRKQVTYRSFKSLNEREYINDLEMAPFHVGEIFNDVDDQYFYFSKMFSDITNEHVPLKTRNVKPNPPPFMKCTYRKSIMNKARLQHRKENFPNNTNWENFRVQRNLTTKLKRKSVRTYFHERCGDDGKSDSKTFYNVLSTQTKV
jgi:hypothetical protein